MNHPSEHILETYTIAPAQLDRKKYVHIEKHVASCEACSQLCLQIKNAHESLNHISPVSDDAEWPAVFSVSPFHPNTATSQPSIVMAADSPVRHDRTFSYVARQYDIVVRITYYQQTSELSCQLLSSKTLPSDYLKVTIPDFDVTFLLNENGHSRHPVSWNYSPNELQNVQLDISIPILSALVHAEHVPSKEKPGFNIKPDGESSDKLTITKQLPYYPDLREIIYVSGTNMSRYKLTDYHHIPIPHELNQPDLRILGYA